MNNNCCSEISSLVFQSASGDGEGLPGPGCVCAALSSRKHKEQTHTGAHTDARTHRLVLAACLEQGNQISSRERRGGFKRCREPIEKSLQAHIDALHTENPHAASRETKNNYQDASRLLERQGERKVANTSPVQAAKANLSKLRLLSAGHLTTERKLTLLISAATPPRRGESS